MHTQRPTETRAAARLTRLAPLAGVGFALLTVGGDLAIGPFPDSNTSVAKLVTYYSAHHARIYAGGVLLAWAAIFLAVFGAALATRIWRAGVHPVITGAALVGTAVAVAEAVGGASAFVTLGDVGGSRAVSGTALQALHISASDGGIGVGGPILLFAVAVAGIAAGAMPRWLAWPALLIGVLEMTPFGFVASLVFLLWALVAGIALCLRPGEAAAATTPVPANAY
jgi:hypothetical protein